MKKQIQKIKDTAKSIDEAIEEVAKLYKKHYQEILIKSYEQAYEILQGVHLCNQCNRLND